MAFNLGVADTDLCEALYDVNGLLATIMVLRTLVMPTLLARLGPVPGLREPLAVVDRRFLPNIS